MPTYDYLCPNGHRFEVIHSVSVDGPSTCPVCGAAPVRKAFTAPTIHFKGSGWAKKDRSTASRSSTPAATADSGAGAGSSPSAGADTGSGSGSSDGADTGSGSGSDKRDGSKTGTSSSSDATKASDKAASSGAPKPKDSAASSRPAAGD